MTISERLFDFMEQKSITSYALCQKIGIGTSTVNNWKTRNTDPPSKLIVPICECLGCSVEYLLTGQEAPQGIKKEPTQEISPDELEMLELFRALPYKEQQRAIGRLQTLVEVSKESSPQQATGGQSSAGKDV